jgi:hypothetical protein
MNNSREEHLGEHSITVAVVPITPVVSRIITTSAKAGKN